MVRDAEEEAVEGRRSRRIGEFIEALGSGAGVARVAGWSLKELRIRFPTEEEPSTLLIVKAQSPAGGRIAFVGAYSAADAVLAWRKRCTTGGLKWREDLPWDGGR